MKYQTWFVVSLNCKLQFQFHFFYFQFDSFFGFDSFLDIERSRPQHLLISSLLISKNKNCQELV